MPALSSLAGRASPPFGPSMSYGRNRLRAISGSLTETLGDHRKDPPYPLWAITQVIRPRPNQALRWQVARA
jgi:hypothetical protein